MSALWLSLTLVALLGYIWFRNFWPEWTLSQLGKTLGIPQADLVAKRCIRERLQMVRAELQQKYIGFFYRVYDLVYAIPDPTLRAELDRMLQSVSEHGNPDPGTWSTVTEVLERIADSGVPSVLPGEIALRAQGYELEDLYADYYRLERRFMCEECKVEESA